MKETRKPTTLIEALEALAQRMKTYAGHNRRRSETTRRYETKQRNIGAARAYRTAAKLLEDAISDSVS